MMKGLIGAVVLAAGTSSRMGQQKLLLPLAGKPLLAHVLESVIKVAWADCLVVIGEPQGQLAAVCDQYQFPWIYNAQRCSGQASSIQAGLQGLRKDLDGILFIVGDQPFLSPALLQALVDRFVRLGDRNRIIVPRFEGQRYNPSLFGAAWFSQLALLTEDQGGRTVIKKQLDWVTEIEWSERSSFWDADTWEEYQMLCSHVIKDVGKVGEDPVPHCQR